MQSARNMPKVQFDTWQSILSPDGSVRLGQGMLWTATLLRCAERALTLIAVLPTGYGKTYAALGAYLILRSLGLVDRCLVCVPTDEQRRQWATGAPGAARWLGHRLLKALELDDFPAAFRYNETNGAELFVATYHQVTFNSKQWIKELVDDGQRWFVVFDEFHHLAEEAAWGRAVDPEQLPFRARLIMSATPLRSDKRLTAFGLRDVEAEADAYVSVREAMFGEKVIRRITGRNQHYFVDVIAEGADTPERIRTTDLKQDGVTDFSKYETKRKLRFVGKYLSKMLLDAVDALNTQNLEHPKREQRLQHQMLVFAMTCKHAESVTEQLNALAAEPGFANYIGITRPDAENKAILKEYREGRLPCLVQIDKAGEGFDVPTASILVFLHLISAPVKLLQQLGRGLRRNPNLTWDQDVCIVFASADSEVAEIISKLELSLQFEEGKKRECSCCDACPNCDCHDWPPLPDLSVVDAIFEMTEMISPERAQDDPQLAAMIRMARDAGASDDALRNPQWLLQLYQRWCGITTDPQSMERMTEKARRDYLRSMVEQAVGRIAYKAAKLIAKSSTNNGFEKSWIIDLKKKINGRWVRDSGLRASEMTADDFAAKYKWLRDVYEQIRETREVPAWLTLW